MCGLFSLTVKLFMLLTPRWSNQLRMLEPLWREVELQGWRWVKVEVTLRARDCLLGRDRLFTLEWVDCIMPLPNFFFLFFWKFSSSTVLVFKMSSYSFSRGLKWLAGYKRKKKTLTYKGYKICLCWLDAWKPDPHLGNFPDFIQMKIFSADQS